MTMNDICPYCDSRNLIEDDKVGEIYCSECGAVVASSDLSRAPEWRVFDAGKDGVKIRASISGAEGPTYTTFRTDRDSKGTKLDAETSSLMSKLKHYDSISKAAEALARSVDIAGVEIDRLGYLLHVPVIIRTRSRVLYHMSLEKDLVRGRSIDAFVAACVYLACREREIPRSLNEVIILSTRGPREVARTYRLITKELGITPPQVDACIFVPRIVGTLDMKPSSEEVAIKILKKSSASMSSAGKDPRGLAAAAVYIAGTLNDDHRTQKRIAELTGITEVTVRNRMNGLKKVMAK